ncbi:MAG: NAD-dependent dehydratase [Gammaproteobacteria bacterium]|jgi:GDP-L-fucose synthase|nr:NAD-dependent dehydratase [Gammaproteobacteria bacterium]|tara:strand:- start:263 stop:1117 length:855 start_codon:yes stop_codon:yes gene_type:complete
MKILITGTNGFVGRNLSEYYQERYENVSCPKRGDLDLVDTDAVENYLDQDQFDVVVHCGVTLTSVEQNLKMYFNLERCSKSFGKLICVGSGSDYGPKNLIPPLVREDFFGDYVPADIYGFSKYVIAKNVEDDPKNITNLRVFGIYGKYEDYTRRFISNNICRVLAGKDISINRNMLFDYLYVNDFSRMLEIFIKNDPLQKSYNICTSDPIDFLTYAAMIRDVDGGDLIIEVKQEGMNTEYSGDNTRFLQEFGNFSFTEPEVAISELYDWYRNTSGIKFDQMELG